MSELTIEVQTRSETGKNANRRLRASGHVPAVVYGEGKDPVTIKVHRRTIEDLMRSASGENTVFQLSLAGTDQNRHAMIRELQSDPIRGDLVHIDFQRISMTQKVRVSIPIEVVGTAAGVKNQGGMVDFVTREVEVECLPADIPSSFEIDVTPLDINQHLEAKDLDLPDNVTLLEEPDRVLVAVHGRTLAQLAEEAAEEAELLEAKAAEPEVIGREKDEDDEDKE